jgi:hypothetical protein
MKLLLALILFSVSAFAQDYVLYQAENEHYRDYTREELMARLGPVSEILPAYACNGVNEFDIFWAAPRQNEAGDSLKIALYQSDEKIVYKKGSYFKLNGEPATDLGNIFVDYVVEALKKIEDFPEGARLLRELERSHFPLTIVYGGNAFNPHDKLGRGYHGIFQSNALSIFNHGRMTSENVPFEDIGAGGNIGWNPKTKDLPPHVALAHEMFHALDSVRGILDMRFVQGAQYEHTLLSEHRAVYLENLARQAIGFELRTHYGQDQTGPGVLDENGRPRKMPAPCLTNDQLSNYLSI